MGSRNQPEVDVYIPVSSHPVKAFLLEHAEQIDLHLERDFAYFIQEQSAASDHFQATFLGAGRPGKRARLMAEELTFEQGLGKRSAVNSDKRSVSAIAAGVDGFGD